MIICSRKKLFENSPTQGDHVIPTLLRPVRCLTLLIVLLAPSIASAQFPNRVAMVNDFAGIIPNDKAMELEGSLRQFQQETGIDFVVVTVPTLSNISVEHYALQLANAWGVGRAGHNDGLVFLSAPVEHKTRIEVGLGLEALLPDVLCEHIMEHRISPHNRSNDRVGGIIEGVEALQASIRLSRNSSTGSNVSTGSIQSTDDGNSVLWVFLIIVIMALIGVDIALNSGNVTLFFLYLLPDMLSASSSSSSSGDSGGGFGGGGATGD